MVRGLYIVNFGHKITFDEKNESGVVKKIYSQIKAFNEAGLQVELHNAFEERLRYIKRFFYSFFNRNQYLKVGCDVFDDIDFAYVRHFSPIDIGCITLLRYLKSRGCYIIYEVPTYPYDDEYRGLKGFVIFYIDKIFRQFLKKYVDYISTYSNDDYIFDVQTIKIKNGIDCSLVPVVNPVGISNSLRLVAVAQFDKWHGYDRLIKGLYYYYKKAGKRKIFISFVGDGYSISSYIEKVKKYDLSDYVSFHGVLSGFELTNIFNSSDIAIASLGDHRRSIYLSSGLKTREYLARGLPIVSSAKIDILDSSYPYVCYVPEDETYIDLDYIYDFYDRLTEKEEPDQRIKHIREFAEKNCDMTVVMKPVVKILSELMQGRL